MTNLPEKTVPSWANAMVANYRRQFNIPSEVTDAMIFWRLEDARGMDTPDKEAYMAEILSDFAEGQKS